MSIRSPVFEELATQISTTEGELGEHYLKPAIRINLNRIKNLRQNVLKIACQGKLVSQDPNDEPAEILLQRIRQEKSNLGRQE
jgi:hypothetical protein